MAKKKKCALIGKPCIQHDCEQYVQVLGKHPQTGEELSEWGCCFKYLYVFQIEANKNTRSVQAAVESFRNEMVRANNALALGVQLNLLENVDDQVESR